MEINKNENEKSNMSDNMKNHDSHHNMDHSKMNHDKTSHNEMDHSKMNHNGMNHGSHTNHHEQMAEDFKRRFFVSLILTIPILLLSPMFQHLININLQFPGSKYALFGFATILFFYGGKPFFTGAKQELKNKTPGMMTLVAFAITVTYIYSSLTLFVLKGSDFFWELATLIDIMLLGHYIEMKSVMNASKSLDELVKLMPTEANLIKSDGQIQTVNVKDLKKGDKILIKPGEKIPIDGDIYEGASSINESMISGEAVPVFKKSGEEVVGGSINGEGALRIEVTKVGDETFLSQVISLVQEAQNSKSKTQQLADKAAQYLFYIAIIASALTFIIWSFLGKDLDFILARTVTVIVICCPHALGLATPLVNSVATNIAAKNGLLIKDRSAFEGARHLNSIVFDKTGTLTEGKFAVTEISAFRGTEENLLSLAYSMEINSEHPIAQGIVNEGEKLKLQPRQITNFKAIPGVGLEANIDNNTFNIVSPGYIKDNNIILPNDNYKELEKEGKTVVFVLENKEAVGYVALSDIVRNSAKKAIQDLKNINVESIMLTGDNKNAANYVGKQLDIDKVIPEVLPQEKAQEIKNIQNTGKRVGMTGDGVNDAPALATADLGIAIGAGTDVAIETADVILVKDNPEDVVSIIKLSKAVYKKMIQNLLWATGYNIISLPLAAGVLYNQGILLNPAVGAIFMSLSTIIVAINAKSLKIK